jgi:N-acetylmuramic acid 6-phosphate etherase
VIVNSGDGVKLRTEAVDERYRDLDRWPLGQTIEAIIDSNRESVSAVAAALPQLTAAAEGIAGRVASGGRLIYAGAGTSGRLAMQDAAELRPTFGFDRTLVLLAGGLGAGVQAREGAEDDAGAGEAAVKDADVGPADVLIGVAASGGTPYTVAAVRSARARGALTVGLSNNARSLLLESAEFPVCLETGPEVLAGSTRLAAGTAQKIALNALSTAVLVKLGGAYRNLMVGMAPTNEKLRGRAMAIVALATGAAAERAQEALALSGGSIGVAIVMIEAGVTAHQAKLMLEASGGRVRDSLETARGRG